MRAVLLILAVGILCGCAAPAPVGLERPPEAWAPAIARGDAAIEALKSELLQRLLREMEGGGAVAAIGVCRDVAQEMSRRAGEESGVALGRTSHRLRNPANAPRDWLKPWVEEAAHLPPERVGARFYDLGNRVGYARPILTGPMCLNCHGEALDAEVREALARSYPGDRATGFREGELRGFFWVEVPE